MRQEEKEVDGPELEHAEERKRETELVEEDNEEIRDLDGKPYELEGERDKDRSGLVVGTMRKILEGDHVVINDLKLSQRELKALEALQTAKTGRDGQLARFVYAEDRRTLLEQALAVLQPDIAQLEREAGAPFDDLLKEVAGLREKLNELQDSETELVHRPEVKGKGEADTDDKPKPTDGDQSLTGPERKVEKPASSLDKGPEVKLEPKASTLDKGPEVKEAPKAASSLDKGPEVKPEPKAATTLGDAAEIAEAEKQATKKPWWRRPFGG